MNFVAGECLLLRWSSWYDSGPVNRRRWFESSTKLLNNASLV